MKDDQKSHKRKEDGSSDLRPAKAPKLEDLVDESTIIHRVQEALRERTVDPPKLSWVIILVHVFIDLVYTGKEGVNVHPKPESYVPKNSKETEESNYKKLSAMAKSFFDAIQKKAVSIYREKRAVGYDVKDICDQIVTWIITLFESQCADPFFRNFILFVKTEREVSFEKLLFEKNLNEGSNFLLVTATSNSKHLAVGYNYLQREKKAKNQEEVHQVSRDFMPEQPMRYLWYYSQEQRDYKKYELTKAQYEAHANKDQLVLKYCAEPHAALQIISKTKQSADDVLKNFTFLTIQLYYEVNNGKITLFSLGLRKPCSACAHFIKEEENSLHSDAKLGPVLEAVTKAMENIKTNNSY